MVLHGKHFLTRLVELGVVPSSVQRVIIDAQYQDVVKIYVEHLDSSLLLQLEPHDIKDARVIIVGKDEQV